MVETNTIWIVLFLFASLLSSILTGTLTLKGMLTIQVLEEKENALKKYIYRQMLFFYPLMGVSFILAIGPITHSVNPQNLLSICLVIFAAVFTATNLWTTANQWVRNEQISLISTVKKSLLVVFALLIALLLSLI